MAVCHNILVTTQSHRSVGAESGCITIGEFFEFLKKTSLVDNKVILPLSNLPAPNRPGRKAFPTVVYKGLYCLWVLCCLGKACGARETIDLCLQ